MARISDSAFELDPVAYRKMDDSEMVKAPVRQAVAPVQPGNFQPSALMLSSMPSIVTGAEGLTRQFYRGRVPSLRAVLPE
jgi:hypothetical protein